MDENRAIRKRSGSSGGFEGAPRLVIMGGRRLEGEVTVSGAKNAALPILAATLLAEGPCHLGHIPDNRDVETLSELLRRLGGRVERCASGEIVTEVLDENRVTPDEELAGTMRASICLLGPLLAKRGEAHLALPGGCSIGPRPIDLHLKAMKALGAKIQKRHGLIIVQAKRLRGARLYLGGSFGSSVLATANAMTAAVLAEGRTIIEHAAVEPEIEDLAHFLIRMGASIEGAGSHRLVIRGVRRLEGSPYRIIPDRIEAGTWMAAAAATGGNVLIRGMRDEHLDAAIDRLAEAGVEMVREADGVRVRADMREGKFRPRAVDMTTLPYPGFPTDLQAQFMALQTISVGTSVITEKIYPDRFRHAAELTRMGAEIAHEGARVKVTGVRELSGARVEASDLRASAALVIAGLAAKGVTEITGLHHLDRGYENLESKLANLGAALQRIAPEQRAHDLRLAS